MIHISTEHIPISARVNFWESELRRHLIGLRCSPHSAEGLDARLVSRDIGLLKFADVHTNAHIVDRTPELIRQLPSNSLQLILMCKGDGFVYQRGQCVPLKTGDVAVYDSRSPYVLGCAGPMHLQYFEVEAEQFRQRFPRFDVNKPQSLLAGGGGASMIYVWALRKLAAEHLQQNAVRSARQELASDTFDQFCILLEAILGHTQGRGGLTALSATHVLAAKAYIESNLADNDLSVQRVATAVRVSARHLSRLFAMEETSVAEFIVKRRLAKAKAELSDPRCRGDTVATIGYRWGFASAAHFSRLFKQHFGLSPTEQRSQYFDLAGAGKVHAPARQIRLAKGCH